MRIADKSSRALQRLHITGGVIDSGYRGEILVMMENLSDENFIMEKGKKVAQLVAERIGTWKSWRRARWQLPRGESQDSAVRD